MRIEDKRNNKCPVTFKKIRIGDCFQDMTHLQQIWLKVEDFKDYNQNYNVIRVDGKEKSYFHGQDEVIPLKTTLVIEGEGQ